MNLQNIEKPYAQIPLFSEAFLSSMGICAHSDCDQQLYLKFLHLLHIAYYTCFHLHHLHIHYLLIVHIARFSAFSSDLVTRNFRITRCIRNYLSDQKATRQPYSSSSSSPAAPSAQHRYNIFSFSSFRDQPSSMCARCGSLMGCYCSFCFLNAFDQSYYNLTAD